MRIIAGLLKGHTFDSPRGHRTHPMSEKIRGAIFNALGDIAGLTVFDPFAGSGAVGLEALSRGAANVTMLDIDKNAALAINANIRKLAVGRYAKVIQADVQAWLRTQPEAVFDLVVLDPPYDDVDAELIIRLSRRARIGGTVVLSLPPNSDVVLGDGFDELAYKDYGDAMLMFYRATG